LVDDSRGVGEPLNELDEDKQGLRQTLRHNLIFGNYNVERVWQLRNDRRILPTFGPTTTDKFSNVKIRPAPISVDSAVKLYLRPFEDGSYLLRLHNIDNNNKVILMTIKGNGKN
jgi:hypothetical protein